MKKVIKIVTTMIAGLLMTSCSNPVKKEFIESCKSENVGHKAIVEQMRSDLDEHVTALEKHKMVFNTPNDATKKKRVSNDKQLEEKIVAKKNDIKSLNAKYSQLTDSISELTQENDRLITLFISERPNQKLADEKWNTSRNKMNDLKKSAGPIMLQIEEMENDFILLHGQLPTTTEKKIAKRTRKKR